MEIKLTNVGFLIRKRLLQWLMRAFVFLCCFAVFGFTPDGALSQNVTIKEDKLATVDEVFDLIMAQTDFTFVYQVDMFKNAPKVQLKKGIIQVDKLLEQSLSSTSVDMEVKDKTIVIKQKPNNQQSITKPQDIQVSGKVTDEAGLPLAGVSVIIKGTNRGTTTDFEGSYSITVPDEQAILLFSYLGFTSQEVTVKNQATINVSLKESVSQLDEVVLNAGYYNVKQREATGNISQIKAEVIEKQPVSNLLATLEGNVSGVEVVQQSGVPGGGFSVLIRGKNSIANGNDPLYIIDGVPFFSESLSFNETSEDIYGLGERSSPLNSIDPSSIKKIEVLKDADAIAIYGSRGANGVVLITTKNGVEGKTKVDINLYSGIGRVTNKLKLLSTDQYLAMRIEAFDNDGIDYTDPNIDAPDLQIWDQNRYTDWQEELLGGTAYYSDAQISISGGSNRTQFSMRGGYHKETTVFPGDNHENRLSTSFNLHHTSENNKLKADISSNYSVINTSLPKRDLTRIALLLAPNAPSLYNENGDLNWGEDGWNGSGLYSNPLSYIKSIFSSKTKTLLTNFSLSYELMHGLELKSSFGFTNATNDAITATPVSALDPANSFNESTAAYANNVFQNWIIEPQLNWNTSLGAAKLNVLIGTTFLEQINEGNVIFGSGYASEALIENINAADEITRATAIYSQYKYNAVFGRINYNYKGKYILNITGRRDGSSRFGPGKQFANFGAVGLAWIFSNENFLKNDDLLSHGKLRFSHGISGNDQIGDYQFLDSYSLVGSGPYAGTAGLTPQRLFNPNFRWEKNKNFELGIEIGLFSDLINTSINYYKNRSTNQLIGDPLPPTTGFTSIQNNLPATVENSGLEIELNTQNIVNDNFTWSSSLNFTAPRNKLVSFPDLESSSIFANRLVVGEPLNIVKLYKYEGVNPSTGIYEFQDVNNDGIYDFNDRQSIGFIGRDFYGGLTNSLSFKGFQLDFLFQFVKQTGYNYLAYTSVAPGYSYVNQPIEVLNHWQQPGDISDVQKYSTLGNYQTAYSLYATSDQIITDASFIRLKNLSFSWALPKLFSDKMSMDKMIIFLRGQNLFTITNYEGLDPETQNNYLPPLKVITMGINLTF